MPAVRILDDIVVNQIAAGEVVERPSSVVKELVENSIDAGATEVTVVITNGGRSSIEVVDNGCGMSKDDALLAIERFGTSKISSVGDLQSIATHGFRGEALPSIASVSKFRLSTAVRDGSSGVILTIDGGSLRDVADAMLPPGTKVEVRQLFFNVPARRKFLRSEATETGQIKALLVDFALAYPQVRIRLIADGSEAACYLPGEGFHQRAAELRLAGERAIVCDHTLHMASGEVRARALLSQPVECVVNSGRLRLLVNRRSVRDKLMLKAVRDGYGNFLRPGRYPLGVVLLDIPPEEVDVNVHPQKTEVRFRRPEIMFSAVTTAIANALKKEQFSVPDAALSAEFSLGKPWPSRPQAAAVEVLSWTPAARPSEIQTETQTDFVHSAPAGPLYTSSAKRPLLENMRFVGQVFRCYLILEGEGMVALVDMHAAHERVMFYRIKSQLRGGGVHSQMLLLPETVTLPPEKAAQFQQFQPSLLKLGIEADRISENAIIVRSLPALLQGISAQAIFSELFALPEWSDWGAVVSNAWDMAIARLACHRSIRRGRELEAPEVRELLVTLADAEASGFCPHGRPIVKLLREEDFEAMFGRDV
jgi:DNA mismatch repair protein MutL